MIDYGLFMMIYKLSKLIYSGVQCILIVYIILYGIIFHKYHYIRISVLTDPLSLGGALRWDGAFRWQFQYRTCSGGGIYPLPLNTRLVMYIFSLLNAKLFTLLEGKMQKVKTKYKKGGRKRKHFKDKLKTNLIFQK